MAVYYLLLLHNMAIQMTEQEKFNSLYITASEICEELEIQRSAVLYERRKGDMPEAMRLNEAGEFFWLREPMIPYMAMWAQRLHIARSRSV